MREVYISGVGMTPFVSKTTTPPHVQGGQALNAASGIPDWTGLKSACSWSVPSVPECRPLRWFCTKWRGPGFLLLR